MNFQFSIRTAIKESWQIFLSARWFFVALAFVMMVLDIAGSGEHTWWYTILLGVASVIWSYVWISVSLAAVDGRSSMLTYNALGLHLPNFRQFFSLVAVGILVGIFAIAGLVALIIPGIYIAVRLMFATYAYVDRQEGVMASLRYSWHMVHGDLFWTAMLTLLVSYALIMLGVLALIVGALVGIPVSMLLVAKLYRALTLNHPTKGQVPLTV